MASSWQLGAIDSTRSARRKLGIFGTKISPPRICSIQRMTKLTPSSRVTQKRVIRRSVIVILPRLRCSRNMGITLPAAAQDISVAHTTKPGLASARIRIRLHKHLLRAELRGPVKVDRVDRLVGAE